MSRSSRQALLCVYVINIVIRQQTQQPQNSLMLESIRDTMEGYNRAKGIGRQRAYLIHKFRVRSKSYSSKAWNKMSTSDALTKWSWICCRLSLQVISPPI